MGADNGVSVFARLERDGVSTLLHSVSFMNRCKWTLLKQPCFTRTSTSTIAVVGSVLKYPNCFGTGLYFSKRKKGRYVGRP